MNDVENIPKQSFAKLLSTGQLNELRLGMTFREVIDYLGYPDHATDEAKLQEQIALQKRNFRGIGDNYGCMEVLFNKETERLNVIQFEFWKPLKLPQNLDSTWLSFAAQITLTEFAQFVLDHSLVVYEQNYSITELTSLWIPSSRVRVNVEELEPNSDRKISVISVANNSSIDVQKRRSEPPNKRFPSL
ncbi:MAG: hypothetical protein RLP44_20495 [Aggregatilineales bacterium]